MRAHHRLDRTLDNLIDVRHIGWRKPRDSNPRRKKCDAAQSNTEGSNSSERAHPTLICPPPGKAEQGRSWRVALHLSRATMKPICVSDQSQSS